MAETMYCPRCGTEVTGQVGFCRNCGLRIAGLGEFIDGDVMTPKRRRPNRSMMSAGMVTCILALVIALTNAALAPWIGVPQSYGTSVFLLMFGLGLAFIGFGMVVPQKQRRSRSIADESGHLMGAPTNQLTSPAQGQATSIDDAFASREKVPSVTENTTRNL